MTHVAVYNQDLSKLLSLAYEQAPKKAVFLTHLGSLSGVLVSHETQYFCEGYVKCLRDQGSQDSLHRVSYSAGAVNHTFIVLDTTAFEAACEAMKNRIHTRKDTPRKVVIQMVAHRMKKALHFVDQHNKNAAAVNQNNYNRQNLMLRPVFDSKAAYVAWTAVQSPHRRMKMEQYTEIIDRPDIPDDIYPEAWNLLQVSEVMDS